MTARLLQPKRPHFLVFHTASGWRWTFKMPNGRLIATGKEAWPDRASCAAVIERLRQTDAQTEVRFLPEDAP
jgi:uncharacterized protein YegP (UPF0339 family)